MFPPATYTPGYGTTRPEIASPRHVEGKFCWRIVVQVVPDSLAIRTRDGFAEVATTYTSSFVESFAVAIFWTSANTVWTLETAPVVSATSKLCKSCKVPAATKEKPTIRTEVDWGQ
jgi:hypothetical protein